MDQIVLQEAQNLLASKSYAELVSLTSDWQAEPTGEGAKLRALGLLGAGRPQEALLVFPTAAKLLPQDPVVAFAYGQANLQAGQLEAAKECFEQLLSLNPAHPSAKKAIEEVCRKLAARDEKANPMQSITWLYRAWELDPKDPDLTHQILRIYSQNGWQDAANQFAGQLSPAMQAHPKIQSIMATLKPAPTSAPGAPAGIPQNSAFEACPFCRQQIMAGISSCPHCKMQIRASVFQDNKPIRDWQSVTLNIICGLSILLNVVSIILTLTSGQSGTKQGGWNMLTSSISTLSGVLVIFRVDWAMTLAKNWHLMACVTLGFCGCASIGLAGLAGPTGPLVIVMLFVTSALNGFLYYLINYEDQ